MIKEGVIYAKIKFNKANKNVFENMILRNLK